MAASLSDLHNPGAAAWARKLPLTGGLLLDGRPIEVRLAAGHTLAELLVALFVLALALTGGVASLTGLSLISERGAAQVAQSGMAGAQLEQLWHGGEVSLVLARHEARLTGLQADAWISPLAGVRTLQVNVARWRKGDSVAVTFGGLFASPDSGGSLYVGDHVRVLVRPESGLTRRETP